MVTTKKTTKKVVKKTTRKATRKPKKTLRSDTIETHNAIASEIIKLWTRNVRAIWKAIGRAKSTVSRQISHMEQRGTLDKTKDIIEIAEDAKEIVKEAQTIMLERLKERKVSNSDVNSFARDSMTRYSFLAWTITDEKWGMKDQNFETKTLKELDEMRKVLLWG